MSNIIPFRRPDDGAAPTVSQIVEAYLADQKDALKANTWDQRQRFCRRFAATFGHRPFDSIRPSEAKQWLLSVEDWSAGTRWTVLLCVKRAMNWAVKDRMIGFNPFLGLTVPTGEPRRPTTDTEFQAMLRAERGPFKLVLVFLRSTGCRPGEARALRYEWIDWSLCCAIIPPGHHKTGKRTGKARVIPLPTPARKLIELLLRRAGLSRDSARGIVFLNSLGGPWTNASSHHRLDRIRAATGIDTAATLHGIRHLWACQGLAGTSDLKGVSRALGHDRVQTTEHHYLHVRREEVEGMLRVAEQAARRQKRNDV